MSVTLVSALLLQLVSLLLIWHRLGHGWWRRPGSLIVLASVVYDGVSQVLLAIPSIRAQDIYRVGNQQSYVDEATLIMSAGMLAFTFAYLATRPERITPTAGYEKVRQAARMLDYRVLACALLPLAVLTYEGKGYNNGTLTTGAGAPLATSLASEFFLILTVLTAFSVLLRFGTRWFLPTIMAQSLLLAAAGERTPILVDAVALIILMGSAGLRPSRRQVRTALAVSVVVILAITGARAENGRSLFYTDSGLGARVAALDSGITSLSGNGLVGEAAIRLDGVDFAAGVVQAEAFGSPRLSAWAVPRSLLLIVPSAVWSSKLAHGGLNPSLTELDDFGLQQVNFLPGFAGIYMGFLSPFWLALFLALVGMLCGLGERFLFRRCTSARLVLLAGAVSCALGYEMGLPGMLTVLRTAVLIAAVLKAAESGRTHGVSKRVRRGQQKLPSEFAY
jgi:hypothetical protein